MALYRLVDDLMRDAELRQRFSSNPKKVMREYNLNKREKRILLTMDPQVVKNHAPAEMKDVIDSFEWPQNEFPPQNDDFLAEGGGVDPQYPSPMPGIFRYRTTPLYSPIKREVQPPTVPPTFEVVRGVSKAILDTLGALEVTVWGQSLLDVKLKLVRVKPNDGREALFNDSHHVVMGTFRNSIVRNVFSAPDQAGWNVGDEYEIQVINNPASPPPDPPPPPNHPQPKPYPAEPRLIVQA